MNLKNITLHQLRLFSSLGTHLSFTRVAEELHLTQPAVSIQIKRLEENIGMPLVEQMGRQIYLTEAGKNLFEAAREILNRLETMNEDLSGMEATIKGVLHLAGITTAKFFMPHLLGGFLREHPLVEPSLIITNQSRVLSRLKENLDDIVIMGRIPDNMDLQATYFLDNPLVVVAPSDHPLRYEKNIPLKRIAEEKFLSREEGSGTRAARKRLFAEHGLTAKTYMELGSGEAIKQAVIAGLGISVVSMHSLRLELQSGLLVTLDVEHFPLTRKWYAVHHKQKKLSNTASHFLDYIINEGPEICNEIIYGTRS